MALIKCPECGQEVSDTAKSCPKCGYRIECVEEKSYLKLSIIGLIFAVLKIGGVPLYLIGCLICILSIILIIRNKRKKIIKARLTTIISVIGIILSLYCTIRFEIIDNIKTNDDIVIEGMYQLNPEKSEKIKYNPLDKNSSYVVIVYDLYNDRKNNEKINNYFDSVQLSLGDNVYNQKIGEDYNDDLYTYFVKRSGYKVSLDIGSLPGGTEKPLKMVATFVVNTNDFDNFDEGSIKWNLSDKYISNEKIQIKDIKAIQSFDEIYNND